MGDGATDGQAFGADVTYKVNTQLAVQERIGSYGIAQQFIVPMLQRHFPERRPETVRVLDVGCGLGFAIIGLRELGYDAWGLEPGGRQFDADPRALPYILPLFTHEVPQEHPDMEKFDLIMSHGVIEHVGTSDGNARLVPDFQSYRAMFICSQVDLLRPRGLLVVCGPNRLFPFDFQHGDHTYGFLGPLKQSIPPLKYLTLPWHEKNHLASFSDLEKIARRCGLPVRFLDESQQDYSSMSQLRDRPFAAASFRAYINAVSLLPRSLRRFLETHTIFVCQRVA